MDVKKPHIRKKKWMAYLALGVLSLLLASTFKAEIGSVFHAVSHILTGSEYSHTHQHKDESLNKGTPKINYAAGSHNHELLAFLHLLDDSETATMHNSKEQTLKLVIPIEAGLTVNQEMGSPELKKMLFFEKGHLKCSFFGDIPTPPPKA